MQNSPLIKALTGLCDRFFPVAEPPRPAKVDLDLPVTVELTLEQIAEIEVESRTLRSVR